MMTIVLMAMLVISAITVSLAQIIDADLTGGVREAQAGQVFHIAQAGVHYAIGKLQTPVANSYPGETAAITDGSTTLGTVAITVNCIDTGLAPPCPGAYPQYRRIISKGTLPVSGPTRTIVAVVQAQPSGGAYGLCALTSLSVLGPDPSYIYGDIGSNGTISLDPIVQSQPIVNADWNPPPAYAGVARAVGAITCTGGVPCTSQVQGGAFQFQSGPVCFAPPLPTYINPSVSGLNVPSATVTTIGSSNYQDVTVQSGTTSGGSGNCNTFTDLRIQAGAAGTTTVVNMNTLHMGQCARLMVLGAGKVDLRLGATTGTDLTVYGRTSSGWSRLGVDGNDTKNNPTPLPSGQLTVWLYSSCTPPSCGCSPNSDPTCAGQISHTRGNATIIAPNGAFLVDDNIYSGSLVANQIYYTGITTYLLDTTGLVTSFSNFKTLRSWKDQ